MAAKGDEALLGHVKILNPDRRDKAKLSSSHSGDSLAAAGTRNLGARFGNWSRHQTYQLRMLGVVTFFYGY